MTIAYFGGTTLTHGTRSNTSLTVPASAPEGAIARIALYIESDTAPTPPTGYTEFVDINHTAQTYRHRIYYKRLGAGEGGTSHAFTHGSVWTDASMSVWSEPSRTIAPSGTSNQGTSGTAQGNTITPVGKYAAIEFLVAAFDGWTGSPPTGSTPTFTERDDANEGLYGASGIMSGAPAATGNKTNTSTSDDWAAALVLIEDVAAGWAATFAGGADNGTIGFGASSVALTFTDEGNGAIPANDEIILLAYVQTATGPAVRTWPSGFTEILTDVEISGYAGTFTSAAWKRASSEGSATYTLSLGDTGDNNQQLIGVRYAGIPSGLSAPFEVISAAAGGFGTPQTAPTITTLTANAQHIILYSSNDGGAAVAAASGYAQDRRHSYSLSSRMAILRTEIAAAGSTGTVSVTSFSSGNPNSLISLSLRTAASGAATTAPPPFQRSFRRVKARR